MFKLQVVLVTPSSSERLPQSLQQGMVGQLPNQSSFLPSSNNTFQIPSVVTPLTSFYNPRAEGRSATPSFKKFLLLTRASNTLLDVAQEVSRKFRKLYPEESNIQIEKLQDSNECDLDPDYTVADVFDSNNILLVHLDSDFSTSSPNSSAVATRISSLNLNQQDTPILKAPGSIKRKAEYEYFDSVRPVPIKRSRESRNNSSIWRTTPESNSVIYRPNDKSKTTHHPLAEQINAHSTDNEREDTPIEKEEEEDSYRDELEDAQVVDEDAAEGDQSNISLPPPVNERVQTLEPKKIRINGAVTSSPLPSGERITSGMLLQEEHPDLSKLSDNSDVEVDSLIPVKKPSTSYVFAPDTQKDESKGALTKEEVMSRFKANTRTKLQKQNHTNKPSALVKPVDAKAFVTPKAVYTLDVIENTPLDSSPAFNGPVKKLNNEGDSSKMDISIADASISSPVKEKKELNNNDGSSQMDISMVDASISSPDKSVTADEKKNLNHKLDQTKEQITPSKKSPQIAETAIKSPDQKVKSALIVDNGDVKKNSSQLKLESNGSLKNGSTPTLPKITTNLGSASTDSPDTFFVRLVHLVNSIAFKAKKQILQDSIESKKALHEEIKKKMDSLPKDESYSKIRESFVKILSQISVSIWRLTKSYDMMGAVESELILQNSLIETRDKIALISPHDRSLEEEASLKKLRKELQNMRLRIRNKGGIDGILEKISELIHKEDELAHECQKNAELLSHDVLKILPKDLKKDVGSDVSGKPQLQKKDLETPPSPSKSKSNESSDSSSESSSSASESDSESESDSDDEVNLSSSKKKPRVVNAPKGDKVSVSSKGDTKNDKPNPAASVKTKATPVQRKTRSQLPSISQISAPKVSSLPSLSELAARGLPDVKDTTIKSPVVKKSNKVSQPSESSDSDSDSDDDDDDDSDDDSDDDDDDSDDSSSDEKDSSKRFLNAKALQKMVSKISDIEKKRRRKSGFLDLMRDVRRI